MTNIDFSEKKNPTDGYLELERWAEKHCKDCPFRYQHLAGDCFVAKGLFNHDKLVEVKCLIIKEQSVFNDGSIIRQSLYWNADVKGVVKTGGGF